MAKWLKAAASSKYGAIIHDRFLHRRQCSTAGKITLRFCRIRLYSQQGFIMNERFSGLMASPSGIGQTGGFR
jgi:hypothetical protein